MRWSRDPALRLADRRSEALLAGLLLTGALFPDVGGFAGKGMAFRLPIFLAPGADRAGAVVAPASAHTRSPSTRR